ncbi:c-type cytochrome [Ruegeria profundi]|uniref:Cytochrome C n=1 Tax=Ruegeria profundi TaxID=1685378 RepID=A0A0X3TBF6_9RHOB|nr:cytochrome c [Ruegeria profundi]KUJ73135.1 cytochrome C [Ruegeria profundi]
MSVKRALISGAVFLIGAALVYFATGLSNAGGVVLKPNDASVVSHGAEVYEQNCASCHGSNLEGEEGWQGLDEDGRLRAPPHDATGHTWHHDGELLFRLTKYGPAEVIGDPSYATNMPAYEGILSDDEIIAVLSYIKSTWPPHIRARHDEMEERR